MNRTFWHLGIGLIIGMVAFGCKTATPGTRSSQSQPTYSFEDRTYFDNIRTVQLYRTTNELNDPVIVIGRGLPLTLEFDELIPEDARQSDFYVDIESCDAFWRPSRLAPILFYEGFTRDRIVDFQRSFFTKVPYVHYRYQFPQENEAFKMSGNYILKVFRNGNPRDVVLTRRFIVVQPQITVFLKNFLDKRLYRDQFSTLAFDLQPGNLVISNPQRDIVVSLLQNFRWDNAVSGLTPRFQSSNRLDYQINLETSFNGGNEFRRIDLMSTRFLGEGMRDITEKENEFEITLIPDETRAVNNVRGRRDLNGGYVVRVQEYEDDDLSADYVRVFFRLKANSPQPGSVHLIGKFTDWQATDDNRMTYNPAQQMYELDLVLKQGVYEYQYGLLRTGGYVVDERPLEGPHSFSENYYSLLVYYRGPTDRNDRILGYLPINYGE